MDEREQTIKSVRQHPLGCWLKAICTLGFYLPWWWMRRLVVTNRRVYMRSGLLSKAERSIPLSKVQDVTVRAGALGRMLGYGTVRVESAGALTTEIVATNVSDPGGVRDAILSQVR